jgi:hypothetical protein
MGQPISRIAFTACLAFMAIGLLPAAGAEERAPQTANYDGKVVPLADLLQKEGVHLDGDAAPFALALVTDSGTIYPLVKDAGSRMFFQDKRLLNRPMRLTGRLLPGSQLLQVVTVHSYVKGELCEVYYWCDVCAIRRNEKLPQCECCGGPLELREVPVKK